MYPESMFQVLVPVALLASQKTISTGTCTRCTADFCLVILLILHPLFPTYLGSFSFSFFFFSSRPSLFILPS